MAAESITADLTSHALDVEQAYEAIRSPEAGGQCLFIGTTRRESSGRLVVRLSYEAYEEMAIRQMKMVAERAMNRWPLVRCLVLHRLGEVPVGEPSVVIGVSSVHRAEAFQACRYLIDEMKSHVPIWKKEVFADGKAAWVEGDRSSSGNG